MRRKSTKRWCEKTHWTHTYRRFSQTTWFKRDGLHVSCWVLGFEIRESANEQTNDRKRTEPQQKSEGKKESIRMNEAYVIVCVTQIVCVFNVLCVSEKATGLECGTMKRHAKKKHHQHTNIPTSTRIKRKTIKKSGRSRNVVMRSYIIFKSIGSYFVKM